jgi:hypothetical protein
MYKHRRKIAHSDSSANPAPVDLAGNLLVPEENYKSGNDEGS